MHNLARIVHSRLRYGSSLNRAIRPGSIGMLMLLGPALFACGSTRSGSSTSSPEVIAIVAQGGNPTPSTDEIAVASGRLVRRCMAVNGYAMPTGRKTVPRWATIKSVLTEPFGITSVPSEAISLRSAREVGFGISLRRKDERGEREGFRHERRGTANQYPSGAYLTALEGADGQDRTFTVAGVAEHTYTSSGCVGSAERDLFGSAELSVEASYLPEDLDLEVERQTKRSPIYMAAAERYLSCLRSITGQSVSEPNNVPNELLKPETSGAGPMTAEEIRLERMVAGLDVRCMYSSGYVQAIVQLTNKYASLFSAPYEKLLLAIIKARARAAVRARAVLVAAGR